MTTELQTRSISRLLKQSTAWCGLNGLMYTDGDLNWTPAPISLVPNVFPREAFFYARDAQPIFNKLIDRIARDRKFILSKLTSVSEFDSFTNRLVELYKTIPESELLSSLQFGILRSDYMVNNDGTPLQVEVNTIASSFGFLSKKVSDFHRHVLERNIEWPEINDLLSQTSVGVSKVVHPNPSNIALSHAMAVAHKEYKNDNAVILFIVQPGERNVADQRSFEAQLWNDHRIKVEFMTLKEIYQRGRTIESSSGKKQLVVELHPAKNSVAAVQSNQLSDTERVVSVAYFRAGYGPNDYPSEDEWSARTLIEHSSAIKCPSVGYQLAGTKAIQAALCSHGVLEQFLSESSECAMIRRCFAAQHSLVEGSSGDATDADGIATKAALEAARKDGSNWVLKPQREGGGNNFYGEELRQFLCEHEHDHILSGYVLMQRIFPLPLTTAFLRGGKLQLLPSISELGVYGTYLSYGGNNIDTVKKEHNDNDGSNSSLPPAPPTSNTVLLNEYAGYLLRTKPSGVDEGGVASGYSVLNSLILSDE